MFISVLRKKLALLLISLKGECEKVYNRAFRIRVLYCNIIRNGKIVKECFALYLQRTPFIKNIDIKNETLLIGDYDVLHQLLGYCKQHNIIGLIDLSYTVFANEQETTLNELKELVKDLVVPSLDPLNPNIIWERFDDETYKLTKKLYITLNRVPFINGDMLSSENKKNIPDVKFCFREPNKDELKRDIKKSIHKKKLEEYVR